MFAIYPPPPAKNAHISTTSLPSLVQGTFSENNHKPDKTLKLFSIPPLLMWIIEFHLNRMEIQ